MYLDIQGYEMPLQNVGIAFDVKDDDRRRLVLYDDTGLEVVIIGGLNPNTAIRLRQLISGAIREDRESTREGLERELRRLEERRAELQMELGLSADDGEEDFTDYDIDAEVAYQIRAGSSPRLRDLNWPPSSQSPRPYSTGIVPYVERPAEAGERQVRVRQATVSMRTLAERVVPDHLSLLVRRGGDRQVTFTLVLRGLDSDPRFEVTDPVVLDETFTKGGKSALDGLLKHFLQKVVPALKDGHDVEPLAYTYQEVSSSVRA